MALQVSLPPDAHGVLSAGQRILEVPPLEVPRPKAVGAHAGGSATPNESALTVCPHFACEPALLSGFDSQQDVPDASGTWFPQPDAAGDVGPEHLVTMLSNKVLVQDRSGAPLVSMDLSVFWSPLGTTVAQARLYFDAASGRWIASARNDSPSTSAVLFAISDTADPTGTWNFYSFLADPALQSQADWLCLGYNGVWITITANMLDLAGNTLLGAKMWAIDKASALAGGPITVNAFPTGFMSTVHGLGGSSLHPARTFDAGEPTLWIVNDAIQSNGSFLFQLTRITGTGPAPSVSGLPGSPFGGTSSLCFAATNWSGVQRAMAQVDDPRSLSPFSVRIASVVVRNGSIWLANSGGLPGPSTNPAPTSNGVIWHQLDPSRAFPSTPGQSGTMVVQSGAITNGVDTMSAFPSIAVNCANDVLIGFANSDATISPRAVYTTRAGGDTFGAMGPIRVLRPGDSRYWKGSTPTAAWGRYTSSSVDPLDDKTMWTLQQYAAQRTGPADEQSRWGTFWGRVGWDCCDDIPAPLTADGDVIFPSDLDPSQPIEYSDVNEDLGFVKDIYGNQALTTDTWYRGYPCLGPIGGTLPDEAVDPMPAVTQLLSAAGIEGITPEEIAATLAELEEEIAAVALAEGDRLLSAGPITPDPYVPPLIRCLSDDNAVFGGRDIVFVHGHRWAPILAKINPLSEHYGDTLHDWGDLAGNPTFFDPEGYWKNGANEYWDEHINEFLANKTNRYLVVTYASTQRVDVAVQAVLTQIDEAMRTGRGVIDLSGNNYTRGFGAPGFVIISHSTGALVTDIALSSAADTTNHWLNVPHIPRLCKAHIALHGAFSGTTLATVVVAASAYARAHSLLPPWLDLLVTALDLDLPLPLTNVIFESDLIDLVPLVSQLLWGGYLNSTPVPTLTVVGGHPSYFPILKNIVLPGLDDGTLTINSQVANPNCVPFWPSGFDRPPVLGLPRLFDMGLAVSRDSLARAVGYFVDQSLDRRIFNPFIALLHPFGTAGGATPFISPSGMLQPVIGEYAMQGCAEGGGFNPLRRYNNHYSFLQSTADHFGAIEGFDDSVNGAYKETSGKPNDEESRVITDPALYETLSTTVPYGDSAPLLTVDDVPQMKEVVRGRRVTFSLFGAFRRTWWIWKRRYHLLEGWENRNEAHYLYDSVLRQGWSCATGGSDVSCSCQCFVAPQRYRTKGIKVLAGNVQSLSLSNDASLQLRLRRFTSTLQRLAVVTVEGNAGIPNPSVFLFKVEAKASAIGSRLTIQLYDWVAGRYDAVSGRSMALSDEEHLCTVIPPAPSRFLQNGTGAMRARILVRGLGNEKLYLDHVAWELQ